MVILVHKYQDAQEGAFSLEQKLFTSKRSVPQEVGMKCDDMLIEE